MDFVGKREFFEGDCYFPGERRIGLVKVEDPEGFDGEDNMAYYEIERRAELLSSSTNPFRNSHFRSRHSSCGEHGLIPVVIRGVSHLSWTGAS